MVVEVRGTGGLNYSDSCGDEVIFLKRYLVDLVMEDRREESSLWELIG